MKTLVLTTFVIFLYFLGPGTAQEISSINDKINHIEQTLIPEVQKEFQLFLHYPCKLKINQIV
jgi:predicted PurR-regulated permease PerM